jgi:pimeloyl-ACP methyl ester carboxylesterase
MDFETQDVALAGGQLSCLVAGSGPPLLYLHPQGGPLITPFLQGLAERRRVFAPVMPGFMDTPRLPGVETMRDLAHLTASIAEGLFGEPVDVMGASFGGWVALWLAVVRPDIVRELVLEAPAGLRLGMTGASLTPEQARANLFAYPDKHAAIAFPRDVAIANSAAGQAYSQGVLVDQALAERVGEIQTRTLVLMGTKDITIPPETGRFLARVMPSAHVTYIYDAAHALQVDQPEATLRVVLNFLDRGKAFIVAESRTAL